MTNKFTLYQVTGQYDEIWHTGTLTEILSTEAYTQQGISLLLENINKLVEIEPNKLRKLSKRNRH